MVINYKNNYLKIEDVDLKKLISKYPTPFYAYSHKSIVKNYKRLKKYLKRDIYYSIKANSNQAIITLISKLGAGVDVVSGEELQRVLKANIKPNKIMFEGVGKKSEDIILAIKNDIKQINIESLEEIEIINKFAKLMKKKVNIGIRINPNIDAKTKKKISTGLETTKFGINLNDLKKAIKKIKNFKNINLIGISCHIGSQIFSLNVYEKLFKKMINIEKLFRKNKLIIKNLDLGGGMGFDYKKKKNLNLIRLSQLIKKYFKDTTYKISFEPGRYLVANSGVLVSKILMIKSSKKINFLIIDAGMNTFIRPALYNDIHNIIPLKKGSNKYKYCVVGPICENSDTFANNVKLPKQSIGNIVVIEDVGAYGSVMSSNYNSKTLPAEILIKDKKFHLIRKYQKINELISKDSIPKWIK